jgi:hypothetical protein
MSLIQNNPLEDHRSNRLRVHTYLIVGSNPHDLIICTRYVPLICGQCSNGKPTCTELKRPGRHESGWADNECATLYGILQETNDLKGLTEPHVIGQNTSTTLGFTIHHPPNTGLLVLQILNIATRSNECHSAVIYRIVTL